MEVIIRRIPAASIQHGSRRAAARSSSQLAFADAASGFGRSAIDDAKDYFDAFCDKYVRDEASRSRLKAQLQYLIEKDPAHFRSDAFSPTVVREYGRPAGNAPHGDAPRGASNDRRAPAAGEPPVPERRGCVIVSSCDVGDRQALPLTLPAPSRRRARPQYRVKISLDGALAVLEPTSPALLGVLALSELQLQPKALLEP